jgi:GcrA cell cycle regulator
MSARRCAFPIGDPREPDFDFCGKPVLPGSPYCPGCAAIAYRREPRDVRVLRKSPPRPAGGQTLVQPWRPPPNGPG